MRCRIFSHNGREERQGCEKKWSFILPAWRSTIEPVFGSLVHHYGLSKINVLRKPATHKVMVASAICFNLKSTSNIHWENRAKCNKGGLRTFLWYIFDVPLSLVRGCSNWMKTGSEIQPPEAFGQFRNSVIKND